MLSAKESGRWGISGFRHSLCWILFYLRLLHDVFEYLVLGTMILGTELRVQAPILGRRCKRPSEEVHCPLVLGQEAACI